MNELKAWALALVFLKEEYGEFSWVSKFSAYTLSQDFDPGGWMPTDSNGEPIFKWTLRLLDTDGQAAILNDSAIYPLPVATYDTLMADIDPAAVQVLRAGLDALGISAEWLSGDTLGDAVTRLATQLHSEFDLADFPLS